ncbi:hypothetical protein F4820DRAFT_408429 [Hypoxylon rubiginosum]|uniref:Uncharacterized protein n=1 Tax=Hypoxylon rubiginosum TaxID=110542 RepID=A0ACB9ZBG2_9PEZI|nr:hypothetical protein F4820DRAFT_408429 [Hypoxylon rubiginosum]
MESEDAVFENMYQAAYVGEAVSVPVMFPLTISQVIMTLAAGDMDEVKRWKLMASDSWAQEGLMSIEEDEFEEDEYEEEEGEVLETYPQDPWEGDLDRHKRSRHPDALLPLLQRCMAKPEDMPTLREVFERCIDAVYTKSAGDFMKLYQTDQTAGFQQYSVYETDQYIQTFIQENILDANVDPFEIALRRRRDGGFNSMPTTPIRPPSRTVRQTSVPL